MDISTQSLLAVQLWEALVDTETTNPKVYFPYSAVQGNISVSQGCLWVLVELVGHLF